MEKRRIMVVDDELDFLETVKAHLLRREEFEVMTLSTAKDIMHHVNEFKPDVILLDLLMPTIGGFEVCDMLNKDTITKKIPIIIISALNKYIDKRQAYKLGVVDYIVKPITPAEIVYKIEKALEYKDF